MRQVFGIIRRGISSADVLGKRIVEIARSTIEETINEKPNTPTIFWMLICLRISFGVCFGETVWLEYCLWVAVCFFFIRSIFREKAAILKKSSPVLYIFLGLAVWLLVGCLFNISFYSLKVSGITIVIACFIMVLLNNQSNIQLCYFRTFYYLALSSISVYTVSGVYLGNMIPGCIVFLTCAYLAAEFTNMETRNNEKPIITGKRWVHILVTAALTLWICWVSRARTAIMVAVIIAVVFAVFTKLKKRYFPIVFWACILGMIAFCGMYIFIRDMPFYEALNDLSIKLFDKNIDSARPSMWRQALMEMSWWQYIIGSGTGKLLYFRDQMFSYHNTYIQLLAQNGIIGLGFLFAILTYFWMKFSKYVDDGVIRLILAMFVGIMIYNCFETTLLQNKTFLGIIQWLVLIIGVFRCRYLTKEKEKNILCDIAEEGEENQCDS